MWVQYSVTIATLINYKLYKRPLNVLLKVLLGETFFFYHEHKNFKFSL